MTTSRPIPKGSYIVEGDAHPPELPWRCISPRHNVRVRVAPTTASDLVRTIPAGTPFVVVATIGGGDVEGSTAWLQLASGGYVSGAIDGLTTESWRVGEGS